MSNFGKRNLYDSANGEIDPKGGCNCGALCANLCSCSCSGGTWSFYHTNQVKGSKINNGQQFRSPGEIPGQKNKKS
ncbi:hypothetical protein JMW52_05090 [Clostridioides difficile]|uniref:hypothetical protein n=1 Tax=Clostridioides difficile TaxID=1496 RepID=UPI001AF85700|nr:hypothetical protein [Clostridioides difficile]QQY54170.1 hypothetical protein JMW52_05090 [Clostridioides difficile]WKK92470.1 hypothetical protein Q0Y04_21415 [Clostridioides difficile]